MSDKEAVERLIHSAYQARAIAAGLERYSALPDDHPGDAVQEAIIAALAAARPHILEEAAKCLEGIADAMEEKAEAIRAQSEPFDPATSDERDAAVTAFEFRRAAAAIRAAKETDK